MSGYQSMRALGLVTALLLLANAGYVLVSTPSALMQLALLERMERGDFTMEEANANDAREAIVGVGTLVIYLATAIVFLFFINRAYRNTVAFGHTPHHGTGWSVGAWFVPILNLFRPFQITREIWCASDPDQKPEDVVIESSPPLLVAWWASWIIGNIAGQAEFRLAMNADTLPSIKTATMVHIGADVITLVSAPLAALVVWGITKRQEERSARMERGLSEQELEGLEQTFR